MKPLLVVALILGSFAFVGCDSLSDATSDFRERFSSRAEPRTKTFSGPPRVVYEAVKQAATMMGYGFTRGGPAQGEFEGVSSVGPGETRGSARQVGIKVRLHGSLDGDTTEVGVRFTEILEADSNNRMGMATETTMKDTPLYEVFFRHVKEALDTRPTAQPIQPAAGGSGK